MRIYSFKCFQDELYKEDVIKEEINDFELSDEDTTVPMAAADSSTVITGNKDTEDPLTDQIT